MRRALDRLYAFAFAVSAACLAAIAALVLAQVAGRLLDRALDLVGLPALGFAVPSLAEIGAFLFVSAVFLGMAGTLRAGGHVRVTLATQRLGPRAARVLMSVVVAIALALCVWAAWNSVAMLLDSLRYDAVSYGMVRVPLALPQGMMALGLVIFCIALADEGWALLQGRSPSFRAAEAETEAAGDAAGTGGH